MSFLGLKNLRICIRIPQIHKFENGTLELALCVCRSICLLVHLHLPKYLIRPFHHCPCPPARDLASRVSGLVIKESVFHLSISVYLFRYVSHSWWDGILLSSMYFPEFDSYLQRIQMQTIQMVEPHFTMLCPFL